MYKLAAAIGVSIIALGGVTAPVVSTPMHWDYAYQASLSQSGTSTPSGFTDDGSHIVSVAVFRNHAGELVQVQIPNSEYHQMGQQGGHAHNPAADEQLSAVQALTPAAHAAIARDAHIQNQALNSLSITFSDTVSGSNRYLIVAAMTQTGSVSGVTYNGVSMSQVGTNVTQCAASGQVMNTWGLIAPATGANNVVVTRSATANTWLAAVAASYTGVNQSTPTEGVTTSSVNGLTASFTTTVANDWGILNACNTASGGGTPGAGTGSSAVFSGYFDQESLFDSNATLTVGSNSMTFTASGGNGRYNVFALEPAVAATIAPDSSSDFILFN